MRELYFCMLLPLLHSITTVKGRTNSDTVIARKLSGDGFHRNLETTISISQSFLLNHKSSECAFLLFETLPPGVYADQFQVQSLVPFGGPQVLFDRSVNIEAAEFSSKSHELFLYLNISKFESDESSLTTITVSLPIHARYHRPSGDPDVSHSVVTILPPGLYSNCLSPESADTISAPCDVANSSMCMWTHLAYRSNEPIVQLHVPVGQQKDIPLVVLTTLLVTVTVCVLLIKVIWTSQMNTDKKNT